MSEPAADNILELTDLTKRFGGLVAVDNVSLNIKRGEVFALIGPNGAGKTTLFNLVNGYFRPTSGEIRFRGERIDRLRPHQVCRRGLARTFQVVKPLARLSAAHPGTGDEPQQK